MSFLSTLLSRSQHQVSTRQALMVVGLQNDFTSPDGKLPVNSADGYLERIKQLVPAFREHGEIFWVRTEYRENRPVNNPSGSGCMVIADDGVHPPAIGGSGYSARPSVRSSSRINQVVQRTMDRAAELGLETVPAPEVDQDLFLSQTNPQDNCCLPGSWGAEFSPDIRDLISPRDVQVVKSYYSAFTYSSLLLMLRSKFITELYVVGCTTNLSVYATALDAAQHGLTINLVEDCLNYRHKERHERAIQRLVDIMGASVTSSASVMSRLRGDSYAEESGIEAGTGLSDAEFDDRTGPVRESSSAEDPERHLEDLTLSEPSNSANDSADQLAPAQHAELASSEHPDAANRRIFAGPGHNGGVPSQNDTQEPRFEPESSVTRDVSGAGRVTPHDRSMTLVGDLEVDDTVAQSVPNLGVVQNPGFPYTVEKNETDPETSIPDHEVMTPRHSYNPSTESTSILADNRPTDETRSTNRVHRKPQGRRRDKMAVHKTLGPGDLIGSGGSRMIYDLLEPSLVKSVFQQVFYEVHWQRMYHAAGEVPRLVCCQGDIDPEDGSMPVYRHPADQTLPLLHWSPTVTKIKREAEKRVGHKLNHVLIQLYRSGQDYISEHSDKTLDIIPSSNIVNVSLGAQRTMRLRTKRGASDQPSGSSPAKRQSPTSSTRVASSPSTPRTQREEDQTRARTTQRIPMPHNSMFVMDLATNSAWLHGINQDKRLLNERSAAELSYGGMRISLTFRNIGTFISSNSRMIWGQGAAAKQKESARSTINGVEDGSQQLIDAFGFENQSTSFDWKGTYGTGFDVLHLKSGLPEREIPMLFLSGDHQSDLSVKVFLNHLGVDAEMVVPPSNKLTDDLTDSNGIPLPPTSAARKPYFRDAGLMHTQVEGEIPILLFLDRYHTSSSTTPRPQKAKELELLTSTLVHDLRNVKGTALGYLDETLTQSSEEKDQGNTQWLAGSDFGIVDCAFWPLIRDTKSRYEGFEETFPGLESWLTRFGEKAGLTERTDV